MNEVIVSLKATLERADVQIDALRAMNANMRDTTATMHEAGERSLAALEKHKSALADLSLASAQLGTTFVPLGAKGRAP